MWRGGVVSMLESVTRATDGDLTHRLRDRLMPIRGSVTIAVDLMAWVVGMLATLAVGLGAEAAGLSIASYMVFVGVICFVQIGIGRFLGLYRGFFKVGAYDEAIALAKTWMVVAAATIVAELIIAPAAELPFLALAVRSSVAVSVMGLVRLGWRHSVEHELRPAPEGLQRVVVVGAGEGGYLLVRGMLTDPGSRSIPVALLDDSPAKAHRSLMGVQVAGTIDDLPDVVARHSASSVIVAIPSATSALLGRVVDHAVAAKVEVRTVPPTRELVDGTFSLGDVRPITENDLLGRAEVHVDLDQISRYVTAKRVLVTGAGGSIGSELCRQLHNLDPATLLMLDRDESGLHSTQLAIEGRALLDTPNLIVADIRDRNRLVDVFEQWQPEVVFHAAALKHLTLLEQHPMEGVKTNILGTQNVIDAAVRVGAECVVNVSTDKAADPTSVLGATKLFAEQFAADTASRTGIRVVSVRFGNVLGSRGSVLPTFLDQIHTGGPVTVTDPDVTRYFMTIPEAVRLVLQAGAIGKAGEIMILDMGEPVKIVDLARRLINHHNPKVEIEFTGLRPGEKLHEILVAGHETGTRRDHPRVLHSDAVVVSNLDSILLDLSSRKSILAHEIVAMAVSSEEQLLSGHQQPIATSVD